jgi:hypothetical protein
MSYYIVEVQAETDEQADQVMRERIGHDEDLGFDYVIDYTIPDPARTFAFTVDGERVLTAAEDVEQAWKIIERAYPHADVITINQSGEDVEVEFG